MNNKIRFELLQGNKAFAEAALVAGCSFFAGYPITPSNEIAEEMALKLPRLNGVFLQMEDEIAALGACIGASLCGKKVATATSGPGFSLKQENIGFAAMAEIPVVIVDVMRGGPSTGLPTGPSQSDVMQAKWGTHGDHPIIVISPNSSQEVFYETIRAFNLSEKYRTPVIFLMDENIAHLYESVVIPPKNSIDIIDRPLPKCLPEEYLPYDRKFEVPPMASFGTGYKWFVTGLNHDETGFPSYDGMLVDKEEKRLLRKIEANKEEICKNEEYMTDDAEIVVLAYGITSRSAKMAVKIARENGIKAGLFRPITLWPSPAERIYELAIQAETIIIAEMNLGQYALEVERVVKNQCKLTNIFDVTSMPISPNIIYQKISEVYSNV